MSRHPHFPQSDRIAGDDVPAIGPVVYTIAEFCAAHKISRSKLYALWRRGFRRRTINVGAKNLITAEAECAGRRHVEAGGGSSSPKNDPISAGACGQRPHSNRPPAKIT